MTTWSHNYALVMVMPADITNKPPQSNSTNNFLLTCSNAGVSGWQTAFLHMVIQGPRLTTLEASASRRKSTEVMKTTSASYPHWPSSDTHPFHSHSTGENLSPKCEECEKYYLGNCTSHLVQAASRILVDGGDCCHWDQ